MVIHVVRHSFLFLCLGFITLLAPACTPLQDYPQSADSLPEAESAIQTGPGIEIIGIRLSAAEYMLDFRYRVTDPDQAMPIFHRKTIPHLVHEKSGAVFAVPNPAKVGPLRATTDEPKVGRIYYIFFANPARYVKKGELVSVVIGENRFEHLEVQ